MDRLHPQRHAARRQPAPLVLGSTTLTRYEFEHEEQQ
jgi:hypothetical protein